MSPTRGKKIFHRALRHIQDGCYLLDAPVLEIEQDNGCLFLARQALEGLIEPIIAKRSVCGIQTGHIGGLLQGHLLGLRPAPGPASCQVAPDASARAWL